MLPSSKNCDGTAVEKGEILAQFRRVRDAPSEYPYTSRRDKLLEMAEQLMAFTRYFNKNWDSVREMWFLAGNQLYEGGGCPKKALQFLAINTEF